MMVQQTSGPRLPNTPVWMCSKCGRKFQTKGQALNHEIEVHK